jgi:hypothetical protein|tara:strand:+ start:2902 stop:3273 length:372 start_codon:yes stop_codon:yes gene_type:complete
MKKKQVNTLVSIKKPAYNEGDLLEQLFKDSKKNPRRSLFISVIFQALADATKQENDNEADEIKLNRDQAVAWFFASIGVTCENFEFVCDYAGLSPKDVRSFASYVINSDTKDLVRNRIIKLLA